jgi:hypothetical protein
MSALDVIRAEVGPCRDWPDGASDRCNAPADYVLWGKLFPLDALGPRCYDCAAKRVGHRGLGDPSYAIVDLGALARRLDTAGVVA